MPLEWIFIEIFINAIEVGVLFYLLCSKFTAKYQNFIPTLLFILLNISLITLRMAIEFYNMPITEILVPISCFIYLLFFRNGDMLKKIFWILISFALLYAIAYISITIVAVINNINSAKAIELNSNELLLTMIIAKTLQVVIFYILSKQKKNFESKNVLSVMPMLICLIVPLLSIIFILFINNLVHKNINIPNELIFIISIGYLAMNIIIFVLYEFINREAEKNYSLIAKNKQYKLIEQHNNQVIEIYDKMREWRHDYIHHLQLVAGMLEQIDADKNNEPINYIKNLNSNIKSSSLEIVTGNHIIDAVVSAKAALASSQSIAFEHNILLSDNIYIESTDLCSILSNLLDNAIEACCKLDENKYINLEMLIFKNQFNIKISNSTNGEYKIESGKFKTTKRGDLHGIGMGHVKSIVETYGGIYDVSPESDSFTTHISIPLARRA